MVLPDKVYNILKWLVILFIPGLATFYSAVAPIWGWGYVDEIPKTLIAIDTFLGVIIGISGVNYALDEADKKEQLKEIKKLNGQEDK